VTEASGDMLVRELGRRFVTVVDPVEIGAYRFDMLRPRSAEELISEEEFARDERLPYWADVWPSSVILAERLLEENGRGRRLLELGCGLGVVSVAAMRTGYDVLATDYYEDALRFTRANAWRALGREPRTRLVDWRTVPSELGHFDRVVAADVLYERSYPSLVARVIALTLVAGGEALVADPGRASAAEFADRCEEAGLRVHATETHGFEAGGGIRQRISIRAVRWKE
jgi:ETFB lysine methyltransferase